MRKIGLILPVLLLAGVALAASPNQPVTWEGLARVFAAITILQGLLVTIAMLPAISYVGPIAVFGTLLGSLISAAIVYFLIKFLAKYVA